jgi:ParB-like chromosome segregation protein Spo0J
LKVSEVKAGEGDPRQWAIFERQRLIHEHIDKHGMINPIVVDSTGNLLFGGCRMQYAVLNGWEDIPAIVVDDLREIPRLQREMAQLEYTFLPEEYIEIKQRVAELENK